MRRLSYAKRQTERGVEVNMSPLVDCVFLLLIFFIVTTVFVEETGVEVQKPKAVSAQDLDKKSLLFALTADGHVAYGGCRISMNSVRGLVARQLADREVPVIILADEASHSGRLVELIDECKLAGAKQVSIAAQRKD